MLIRGNVLTPADEAYERVRAPYNAMQMDRPALIVQCSGTADVVDTVNFARSNGLEVAVRGGGHSVAGLSSSNGGMLIDLALMNGVFVDAEGRLARVQGGALWGDVDRETQLHGLAAPGGIVSDTGSPDSRSEAARDGSDVSTGSRATTSWKQRSSARMGKCGLRRRTRIPISSGRSAAAAGTSGS